jgi:hypothetical protein
VKIKTGGGGVDKDGNSYKLPEGEMDVPDDYFDRVLEGMKKAEPVNGMVMVVPAWLYKELKKYT